MSEQAQSAEAVTLELAKKLLQAEGKGMYASDHKQAASRSDISAAVQEAATLLNYLRVPR